MKDGTNQDGTGTDTSSAAETGTAEGKPVETQDGQQAAEGDAEEPAAAVPAPEPEKKYTDEDMKKARQSFQHETRKERDARIVAETELRVRRELEEKKQTATPAAQPATTAPEKPQRSNFDTVEDFDTAMFTYTEKVADFKAREAVKSALAERDSRSEEARVQTETQKIAEVANRQHEAGLAKYPDFDEVINDAPFTREMAALLLRRENGHDIAYHLSKNPAEFQRLAALSPMDRAAEIGAISQQLKAPVAPAQKATTKAPPPPSTVSGAQHSTKKAEKDMTSAERMAFWEQEKQGRKR